MNGYSNRSQFLTLRYLARASPATEKMRAKRAVVEKKESIPCQWVWIHPNGAIRLRCIVCMPRPLPDFIHCSDGFPAPEFSFCNNQRQNQDLAG